MWTLIPTYSFLRVNANSHLFHQLYLPLSTKSAYQINAIQTCQPNKCTPIAYISIDFSALEGSSTYQYISSKIPSTHLAFWRSKNSPPFPHYSRPSPSIHYFWSFQAFIQPPNPHIFTHKAPTRPPLTALAPNTQNSPLFHAKQSTKQPIVTPNLAPGIYTQINLILGPNQ